MCAGSNVAALRLFPIAFCRLSFLATETCALRMCVFLCIWVCFRCICVWITKWMGRTMHFAWHRALEQGMWLGGRACWLTWLALLWHAHKRKLDFMRIRWRQWIDTRLVGMPFGIQLHYSCAIMSWQYRRLLSIHRHTLTLTEVWQWRYHAESLVSDVSLCVRTREPTLLPMCVHQPLCCWGCSLFGAYLR